LAFAFTFYFCLWCIDAANWRAGLPTTNSETVAEMSELTIRKIAEYALETRAATEKAVEEYFGRIIAELCNDNAALSRAVFAKYKPILAAPIP
jgi:hypothetical protein